MELEKFRNYLLGEGYAASTIRKYYNLLEDLEETHGFDLDEIDDNYKIAEFVHKLDRTRIAKNNISKAINCYLKFRNNDYRLKLKQHSGKKDTWIPTEEQKEQLLNVSFSNTWFTNRNQLILRVLFETGMRVSDVATLRFDDVRKRTRDGKVQYYISMEEEKGDKLYRVYISKDLYEEIGRYEKFYSSSGYIFESEKKGHEHLSTKGIRDVCYSAARKTGDEEVIENFHPHTCRHYRAIELLSEGIDVKHVRDFLGHSDISTTQRYLDDTDDLLFENLSSKDKHFKRYNKSLEVEEDG